MSLATGTKLGGYEIRSKIGWDCRRKVMPWPGVVKTTSWQLVIERSEFVFTRIATSLVLILCGSVLAMSPPVLVEKSCREHPQLVGKCFSVHGRLSTHNGNPAVRLWRIGTKRVLGVSDQRFSLPGYRNIPEDLAKQLDGENEILGYFLVCPFTRPRPGEMQLMCIESAKNIVVKRMK